MLFKATVTGQVSGVVNTTANKKSFQIEVNSQINPTMKAGIEIGTMIKKYVLIMPEPSMSAASTNSSGTLR
jgi:hypothetical protein